MTAWTSDDLEMLQHLHKLCLKNQIDYSIHYSECDHTWDVRLHSAAESENYATRNYSQLTMSIDSAIQHIMRGFK